MRLFYSSFIVFGLCSTLLCAQELRLSVIGSSENETRILNTLSFSKNHQDLASIERESDSLLKRLIKLGYIDSNLKKLKRENDSLFLATYVLGAKITKVLIRNPDILDSNILRTLRHSNSDRILVIPFDAFEEQLKTINTLIAEKGDPFSSLKLNAIQRIDENTLSGTLEIKRNEKRTIDKIILKGYEKFPKSYVKHFLKLKRGKQFNLTQIRKKTANLQQLRFANEVKEPEVLFTNDSTILYLYTEKTKSNNFDGFLGFGTNENTNKLEFDGYLDLQLTNNLNYGETLNLFYKSDEIDQQTIDISANLPFLFSSPLDINIGLNIFRKDTTFSTTSQFAKLNYQINANNKIGIGITSIASSNLLDASFADLDDFDSQFYTLNYQFIKPQYYDPLFPINMFIGTSLGFGNRENSDVKINQSHFEVESYKIFNLNDKNSVFVRAKTAGLLSDNYLDNELFRFGGINSIRGFEENSLVANLFGVINTEYRYRLSNSIYVNSVLDAAYFENDLLDLKSKLFGFGFGFGLLTNAGLFRMNYTSGKTEGQQFRLSDSKVHISLTARF